MFYRLFSSRFIIPIIWFIMSKKKLSKHPAVSLFNSQDHILTSDRFSFVYLFICYLYHIFCFLFISCVIELVLFFM